MLYIGCNAKPAPRAKIAQNEPQALSVATIASVNAKVISLPVWQKLDTLQRAIDALSAQTVRREAVPRYERELEAFNKPDTTIIHK